MGWSPLSRPQNHRLRRIFGAVCKQRPQDSPRGELDGVMHGVKRGLLKRSSAVAKGPAGLWSAGSLVVSCTLPRLPTKKGGACWSKRLQASGVGSDTSRRRNALGLPLVSTGFAHMQPIPLFISHLLGQRRLYDKCLHFPVGQIYNCAVILVGWECSLGQCNVATVETISFAQAHEFLSPPRGDFSRPRMVDVCVLASTALPREYLDYNCIPNNASR